MLTLVVVVSCSKESVNEVEENQLNNETFRRSGSTNPYEYVGEFHNEALAHMLNINSSNYQDIVDYLAPRMQEDPRNFIVFSLVEEDYNAAVANGYDYYTSLWVEGIIEAKEKAYLNQLEVIMLNSSSTDEFKNKIADVVDQLLQDESLNRTSQELLLSTTALAKHSYLFWDAQETTSRAKKGKWGKFWADVGGFVGGFVGTLVYNNNNGGGSDLNPFTNGTAVGGLASAAVGNKKD